MDKGMKSDIVHVKFVISVPPEKFLAHISTQYTHMRLEMLSMVLLPDGTGNCLLQISGVGISRIIAEFNKSFKLTQFKIIFRYDQSLLVNFVMVDPWFLKIFTNTQLNIRFPLVISKGTIILDFITDRQKVDILFTAFEAKKVDYSLNKIGKYRPLNILTNNQETILKDALERGFFEIPRKISLSELAKKHKISPSALSETIRRITINLSRHYLT